MCTEFEDKDDEFLPYIPPKIVQKYSHLATLIGGYFYQGFDIEYGTPENALKDFCAEELIRTRKQTLKDIQAFLAAHLTKNKRVKNEKVIEEQIYKDLSMMGLWWPFYTQYGYTIISWLKHLEAEIQKSLIE